MPADASSDRSPLEPWPLEAWPLEPNRVSRFYRGGALLDAFRGVPAEHAADGDRPEDWVASVVRAWTPPGVPPTDEGLSRTTLAGRSVTIRSLLDADPAAVAGSIVRRAGVTTGVLVKLLDAAIRLPVHAHPTRAFARRHLGSSFGKAEAWIALATRELPGLEPPNVRLGFRRDVGRDELRRWIEDGESAQLLAAMHVRPAHAGDVWFVPPGTPHAIGAGALIVEVQEPTDFSVVAEWAGFPIDASDASLGLGWDVAIDAFDRRGRDDRSIDALRQSSTARLDTSAIRVDSLLGPGAAPFFRAERVSVRDRATPRWDGAYVVGVVTGGAGVVQVAGAQLPVRAGSTFALPAAAAPHAELEPANADPLELIACLPPRPADLDLPERAPEVPG
jgi:mannose-6-phosphate isomerase